jgi:hypothetical protein
MRVLLILIALLLGLIGLFMSVCGGGFAFTALFRGFTPALALIAIPCAIVGVMLIVASVSLVRRAMNRDDTDANR